jgi:hypothetical protein
MNGIIQIGRVTFPRAGARGGVVELHMLQAEMDAPKRCKQTAAELDTSLDRIFKEVS